ncbi:TetR/AcrR family transcriptional regulator [Vineibacter terrae]|uniref:TetR/AcrR family transcriptional regulator n=1 Tax=Vineibacter terrae TaxID=2586908 RepID=UPI002E30D3B5|nr:TetR family transcriptional regulator [Vineibacter terrae]HEX2888131.1 TetR family transcriptional regulator [Vineibacter terrae]
MRQARNLSPASTPAAAPQRRTREQRKLDRHAAILAAARAAFAQKGFAGASIIEIARACGIADGTVYKYFASKQDLLFHVMRQFYEGLIADVEAGMARQSTLSARLRYLVRRQIEAFIEDEDLCRLFIREVRTADDYPDSPLHDLNRRYTSIVVRILESGITAGEVRPDIKPRLVRDILYGSIEHIAWKAVSRGGRLRIDQTTDQLLGIVLHGIAPRPEAARRVVARMK